MTSPLTLRICKRLPHRAFNSANRQRGETEILATAIACHTLLKASGAEAAT